MENVKFNFIGIDPSIISTGLVFNGKIFNYCREKEAVLKSGGYSKWFSLCSNNIKYRFINIKKDADYSKGEITNLHQYNAVTDMVIKDIVDNLIKGLPIKIAIEGYSYGSGSAGDLIDLVTFSTLLRNKLIHITDDITVLSPSTLKLESCKLTYKPIEKKIGGKKPRTEYLYKNNLGISGGSFTKNEMYDAIIENDNLNDDYCTFLKKNKTIILDSSKIQKPLEDCNDAYLLYAILKNKN